MSADLRVRLSDPKAIEFVEVSLNGTVLAVEEQEIRDRFALLLNGYSVLAARERTSAAPPAARIRTVLEQFSERRDRADALEQAQTADDREHIRGLLFGMLVVNRMATQSGRRATLICSSCGAVRWD